MRRCVSTRPSSRSLLSRWGVDGWISGGLIGDWEWFGINMKINNTYLTSLQKSLKSRDENSSRKKVISELWHSAAHHECPQLLFQAFGGSFGFGFRLVVVVVTSRVPGVREF